MRIRSKLLILLLAMSLTPLVVSTLANGLAMRKLGRTLASQRGEILIDRAKRVVVQAVKAFGDAADQDRVLLEQAVAIQAREATRALAGPVPPQRHHLYAEQFDQQRDLPEDTKASSAHLSFDDDRDVWERMLVAYSDQAYVVAPGVSQGAVAADMGRLAQMPDVYRMVRRSAPDLFKWQYTSLEVGLHTTYPAHGGYAPDYDPRRRHWYQETRDAGGRIWTEITDVTTGVMTLTVAQPVYHSDGRFAGVTAIDIPLEAVLKDVGLPVAWAAAAETMFVAPAPSDAADEGELAIIAHARYVGQHRNWRRPVETAFLTSPDTDQLTGLIADAQEGLSGVRVMSYQGRPSLWAYGAVLGRSGGFPIIIVPYESVLAKATEATQYVWKSVLRVVRYSGAGLVVLAAIIALVAVGSSREVTRPVRRLADAARRLAGGDFNARAEIDGRDELAELGGVFNDVGPKLREREHLKHSLTVAMEVQQHLLPGAAPSVPGFDIDGRSAYCDETGGDYYDFLDLVDIDPGKVGLAVGDVTGHGIGAALLMASGRAVLRSHVNTLGEDLPALFDTLNRHLVRDTGDARFMTLFYGVLDGPARSLRWCSAGHDPAVWYRASTGAMEMLTSTGVPLGMLDGMAYEPGAPAILAAGDVVAITSDGVREARNEAEEEFGMERLCKVVAAHAPASASDICSAILRAVNEHIGSGSQEDDVTLMVIKAL